MTRKKTKNTMTTMGHSIPLDLIGEILLKLPAKSVLRFRSVSKSWCSIIDSKKFTDAFMSLSLSRPRLVLAFIKRDEDRLLFFSSPHQNCSFGSSSSSMLVAEKNNILTVPEFKPCSLLRWYSVRGFTCFGIDGPYMVCNPTTRQVIHLSKDDCFGCSMYLGYDPHRDQYKVLRLVKPTKDSRIEHSVCTLGGGQRRSSSYSSWRPIKTNIHEYTCANNGVYVDGVVYYESRDIQDHRSAIGCFDVGSEQLRLIETPEDLIQHPDCLLDNLTNYLGKLAVYCYLDCVGAFILWVLDDPKNQVWSRKTCIFPCSMLLMFRFSGIIATTGEAVYVPLEVSDSYDLLCYDVEKMTERRVRVEGISKYHGCYSSLLSSYVDNITYL